MPLFYAHLDSPLGPLLVGVSERGLALLEFNSSRVAARQPAELVEFGEALAPYLRQLRQYFVRERREFTLPLDLCGSEFSLRCWRALLTIPYGETRSYAEIARQIDSPKACRAVGAANAANPIAIVVPCHRVIASDGTLGGYSGGLDVKRKLLSLEKA